MDFDQPPVVGITADRDRVGENGSGRSTLVEAAAVAFSMTRSATCAT